MPGHKDRVENQVAWRFRQLTESYAKNVGPDGFAGIEPPRGALCDFCDRPFPVPVPTRGPARPVMDVDRHTKAFRGWIHQRCASVYVSRHTNETVLRLLAYMAGKGREKAAERMRIRRP
jgi:hypothetical protein